MSAQGTNLERIAVALERIADLLDVQAKREATGPLAYVTGPPQCDARNPIDNERRCVKVIGHTGKHEDAMLAKWNIRKET